MLASAVLQLEAELPDFTLEGVLGGEARRFTLSGLRGRWVGVFKGVLTHKPLFRSGIGFAAVALAAAVAGWLLGLLFARFGAVV